MCSRQVFAASEEIAATFNVINEAKQDEITNGSPTDATPIITMQKPNKLQYFRWGFPWFAQDGRQNLITCFRSETAYQKFKRLMTKRIDVYLSVKDSWSLKKPLKTLITL